MRLPGGGFAPYRSGGVVCFERVAQARVAIIQPKDMVIKRLASRRVRSAHHLKSNIKAHIATQRLWLRFVGAAPAATSRSDMEQFPALGMTNGFARGEENHIFHKIKKST